MTFLPALPGLTPRLLSLATASAAGTLAALAGILAGPVVAEGGAVSRLSASLIAVLAAAVVLGLNGEQRPRLRWGSLGLAFLGTLACLGSLAMALMGDSGTGPAPSRMLQSLSVPASVALLAASLAVLLRWGRSEPSWAARQAAAVLALVPLVAGFLGVMGFLSGMPLLYGAQRMPMSLPAGTGALLLGTALVVASGLDTWPLALFQMRHPERESAVVPWFAHGSLGLFLLVGMGVLGGGSLYLRGQIRSSREGAQRELAAVADLKVRQIAQWYGERREDGEQILRGGLIQSHLARFLAGGPQASPKANVLGWTRSLQNGPYRRILLLDGQGRVRLSVPPEREADGFQPGPADSARIQEALRAPDAFFQDLHREADGGPIHLNLWVPIGPSSVAGAPARGVLLLMLDPRQFLFPLIQDWPAPSASAETLLVRREGDQVAFLNDLRHRPGTALLLRLPMRDHADMAGTQAVEGREGAFEGVDYRGVPVLAALRKVPGTPWFLVSKVDEAEIYGPARRKVWLVEGVLLGLMVLVALAMGVLVRQHDADQIQARMMLEREKRILSDRYAHLMEQAGDIILVMDPEGWIIEANAQAVAQYERSLEALRTLNISDLRAPETRGEIPAQFAEAMAGEIVRFETVHLRADGTAFPVEVNTRRVRVGEKAAILSFVRDITVRKAQERELQRMTRLYAALSQVNQAIVWSQDRQALLNKICEVMVGFGGFSMAWIGWDDPATHEVRVVASHGDAHGYLEGVHFRSDDSPMGQGPTGMAIREGCACIVNDFFAESKARSWHEAAKRCGYAASAAFPIRLGGVVRGALMVYSTEKDVFGSHEAALLEEAAGDISFALDHLAGEERRREAEAMLLKISVAVEQSPLSVIITDLEGAIEYVNPRFTEVTGYTFEEVLGQNPRILKSPGTPPEVHRRMWATLTRGEVWVGELEDLKKGGEPFWERTTIAPVKDAGGAITHYVAIKEDITALRKAEDERRAVEAQLHQSQKLESLGSLAGGVAHDMNNVLGAILSLASTLQEKADPQGPEFRSLETIQTACLRGRGVVKSLLYFARKDLQEEACIDLNALVKEMTQLLSYTTLKRVRLEMDLQEPIGRLRGDAGALSHALMNLCVNALDAMPASGVLRIQTASAPDGGLTVRVADTGQGMSPEVLQRAMEPFFTTKPQGKGTGLGLPMVYGTMKAHEGSFELRSEPGRGTEAILRFPASRVEPPEACAETAVPAGPGSADALRILLVDDDELIRESVASVLEILGHTAMVASGGQAALDLLVAGRPADLVILDMNMPGMNGAEALPCILALRPGLPVLMATGYSDEDIAPLVASHPNVSSIQKPFSMKELKRKLDELGIRHAEPPGS